MVDLTKKNVSTLLLFSGVVGYLVLTNTLTKEWFYGFVVLSIILILRSKYEVHKITIKEAETIAYTRIKDMRKDGMNFIPNGNLYLIGEIEKKLLSTKILENQVINTFSWVVVVGIEDSASKHAYQIKMNDVGEVYSTSRITTPEEYRVSNSPEIQVYQDEKTTEEKEQEERNKKKKEGTDE